MSHNLDELFLEFEDSRYLWGIFGVKIYELLTNDLSIILDEVDELGLHELDDLSHILWDKIRRVSDDILYEISLIENENLRNLQQN